MFLKFVAHNKENQASSFLLEHMDVDSVEDKLDSLFQKSPGDRENYNHRAVLYIVRPSENATEENFKQELENPDNAHLMKAWFIDSIEGFESELTEFLEEHDLHDLLEEE